MHTRVSESALRAAVDELDAELSRHAWGQPMRLFALVASDELLEAEPQLAAELELTPGTVTPVEQEGFDTDLPVDEVLAGIAWPAGVIGAAVAVERWVLPPSAEEEIAGVTDDAELRDIVAAHPQRQDVRVIVAVTRDGWEDTVLHLGAPHDKSARGRPGERLAPGLADALAATFLPDTPGAPSAPGS